MFLGYISKNMVLPKCHVQKIMLVDLTPETDLKESTGLNSCYFQELSFLVSPNTVTICLPMFALKEQVQKAVLLIFRR